MHLLQELLDAVNTDGGHIVLALGLLFVGLFCIARWHLTEGKELFIFALGVLGMAMKSSGKANGKTSETKTVQTETVSTTPAPTA